MTGSETTQLAIGIATRNRPEMLGRLLDSLSRLEQPENTEILFLIVENNNRSTVAERVHETGERVPWARIVFELEPNLGIPFARNRILDSAMKHNCDFLAMIDDDETADPGWISTLLKEQNRHDLDLLGGPVRLGRPVSSLNFLQTVIHRGLVSRARRVERRAQWACRLGRGGSVPVFTNNWLCKLSFLKNHSIRFDEELAFSGGSDKDVYQRVLAAGGNTGWAPEALVYEEIPPQRLAPAYQYARGRDSTISHFELRKGAERNFIFLRAILFSLSKTLLGLLRLILVPFTAGSSFVLALRAFGCVTGRFLAVSGRKSEHYRDVAGN